MAVNKEQYIEITNALQHKAILVAVSKTKPAEDIQALYNLGQRHFGENYVQELVVKQPQMPADIHWHFIGHLQSNKVKQIAPFVFLIHGVDSLKLLQEINKQAKKLEKNIQVLLQVHIAKEETKFGFSENELDDLFDTAGNELNALQNIQIKGLMGMASFTQDTALIATEFSYLKSLYDKYAALPINELGETLPFEYLSMGMSSDYQLALQHGSTMVRIGSLLFGERKQE